MLKIASAAAAAILVGLTALPAPASAASVTFNMGQSQRYVSQQCLAHPNWRGCNDWKRNRHDWDQSDYRQWYQWNRPNVGNVAAGFFGFAVGAAIASSIANSNNGGYDNGAYDDHVAACEARYRSYNPETDRYLGYDGNYHRCNL